MSETKPPSGEPPSGSLPSGKLPTGLKATDFEEIESAVLETERGRWFLTEYARRIRSEGADSMLSALGRIEETLHRRADQASLDARLAEQLRAMEERMLDLLWRLREEKAETACGELETELRALRLLTGRTDAADVETLRLERGGRGPDGAGDLSKRLLSIEKAAAPPQPAQYSRSAVIAESFEEPESFEAAESFEAPGQIDEPPEDIRGAALSDLPAARQSDPRLAAFAPLALLSSAERLAFFA